MANAELRKEADRLGVPFTNDTTDDELRRMIAARENNPIGLEPLQGVEVPQCFGLMWAANTDENCNSCRVQKHCLAKLADETIPRLAVEHGRQLTPPEIANELSLPIDSIQSALEWKEKRQKPVKVEAPPPPPPPAPTIETTKEESVKKVKPKGKKAKASKAAPKAEPVEMKPVETPKPVGTPQDPPSAGSASPAADPAEVPAGSTVTPVEAPGPSQPSNSTGQPGKVKPVPKKAKLKSDSSTSPTRSGKEKQMSTRAKKSPAPKKAVSKKVAPKKAVPKKNGQEPWGEHTFQSRWERERERSPLIAKELPPGSKRSIEFKGNRFTLETRQGHYLLNGEKHPTLYSTVMTITGGKSYPVIQNGKRVKGKQRQMANWSGPKMWRLGRKEA